MVETAFSALVDGGTCFIVLRVPYLQQQPITLAIVASYYFYKWLDEKVPEPLLEESVSMTNLKKEQWTGEGSSAGILHNTVINNLYHQLGDDFFAISDTVIIYGVAKEVSLLTDQDSIALYSAIIENLEIIRECVDSCKTNNSINEYIGFLKRKFPENSQQLTVFETILEGLQKIDPIENNGEYTDRVMRIIDSSAVREPIKRDLRQGLTVANASARLWNPGYEKIEE